MNTKTYSAFFRLDGNVGECEENGKWEEGSNKDKGRALSDIGAVSHAKQTSI